MMKGRQQFPYSVMGVGLTAQKESHMLINSNERIKKDAIPLCA